MGKNKHKFTGTPTVVRNLTRCVNKKGVIKGKNKKDTKIKQGMCVHHLVKSSGKTKPTIYPTKNGMMYCCMCKHTFPGKFMDKDEQKELIDRMIELNDQNKYTSVAINAGDKVINYYSEFGAAISNYKKNTNHIQKIAKKQQDIAKKHKKKKKNGFKENFGSNSYGSWSVK